MTDHEVDAQYIAALSGKQRRARSQLSCTHCRQGKLKCNREQPCDQCIKRNRDAACGFLPPVQKSKASRNVKSRIHHLERLVVDLINSKPGSEQSEDRNVHSSGIANGDFDQLTPPSESETSNPPEMMPTDVALGQMTISGNQTTYVGGSHWTAILDSIDDLKREVSLGETDDHPQESEEEQLFNPDPKGMSFLLRSPARKSKAELIQAMPAKHIVDRLLSQWFNAPDPFKLVVHPPAFQEEYERFWKQPIQTPTMWIGLLYTIMSLASGFKLREAKEFASQSSKAALEDANRYHELAASAAVLADYTHPKPYTIECLLLYSAGIRSHSAFMDVWQLLGLTLRLALRMGYHRDGSHHKHLTVFQQEMRRRVWYNLYMIDVLISFQIGLPSTLRTIQSDVQCPLNLQHNDLSPRMKQLPLPRPADEITPCSYGVAKVGICYVFAQAAEISHATVRPTSDEIWELDRKLEAARQVIPPGLRIQPFEQSITVTSETMMWRFNLALLTLKTKIVLHRRSMDTQSTDLQSIQSRNTCIDSAMQSLRYHHQIFDASQPGGQLEVPRWYMASISTHDFLLASMILCLELARKCGMTPDKAAKQHKVLSAKHKEMIQLLQRSQQIWKQTLEDSERDGSPEASLTEAHKEKGLLIETGRAVQALAVMFRRLREKFSTQFPSATTPDSLATSDPPSVLVGGNSVTPGSSLDPSTLNNDSTQIPLDPSLMDFSMIGDIMDAPYSIDWEAWDKSLAMGQMDQPIDATGWDFDLSMDPGPMPDYLG